ncbi:hypothetical protein HRbin31_00208 [bacterium HR31]|nr:hypothetical protein HRbin31_00208 [bacterium HR31]
MDDPPPPEVHHHPVARGPVGEAGVERRGDPDPVPDEHVQQGSPPHCGAAQRAGEDGHPQGEPCGDPDPPQPAHLQVLRPLAAQEGRPDPPSHAGVHAEQGAGHGKGERGHGHVRGRPVPGPLPTSQQQGHVQTGGHPQAYHPDHRHGGVGGPDRLEGQDGHALEPQPREESVEVLARGVGVRQVAACQGLHEEHHQAAAHEEQAHAGQKARRPLRPFFDGRQSGDGLQLHGPEGQHHQQGQDEEPPHGPRGPQDGSVGGYQAEVGHGREVVGVRAVRSGTWRQRNPGRPRDEGCQRSDLFGPEGAAGNSQSPVSVHEALPVECLERPVCLGPLRG